MSSISGMATSAPTRRAGVRTRPISQRAGRSASAAASRPRSARCCPRRAGRPRGRAAPRLRPRAAPRRSAPSRDRDARRVRGPIAAPRPRASSDLAPRRGGSRRRRVASEPPAGPRVKGSATPGRRTIEIRGRTVPAPAVPRPVETDRRRPQRRAVERVGGRPDRVAMWALLMGLMLILVAIGTADTPGRRRAHAALSAAAARRSRAARRRASARHAPSESRAPTFSAASGGKPSQFRHISMSPA